MVCFGKELAPERQFLEEIRLPITNFSNRRQFTARRSDMQRVISTNMVVKVSISFKSLRNLVSKVSVSSKSLRDQVSRVSVSFESLRNLISKITVSSKSLRNLASKVSVISKSLRNLIYGASYQ